MTSNCTSFTPKHCSKSQTRLTCPEGMDFCMRSRLHGKNKNVITDIERRSCANTRTCYSLSQACDYYHRNDSGLKCDWSCCNKDLCNAMSRPLALCVTPVLVLWVVERWVLDVLGCYWSEKGSAGPYLCLDSPCKGTRDHTIHEKGR